MGKQEVLQELTSNILFEGGNVKRQRIIVYWEFNIDILGPRHEALAERRKARKILSRKRLREIEQAALQVTKAKLPPRFTATVS